MKPLPSRKITVQIKQNSYEIEFPNTGKLIDIELMKMSMTGNKYGALADSGTTSGDYARFTIDMIANLTVLTPDLKKDLKVNSISELDILDSKYLLKIYLKQILPWLNEWQTLLNSDDEEQNDAKENV